MRYVIVLALALLPLLTAWGQPRTSRFTMAWHIGRAAGGPISHIESDLKSAGYGQRSPAGCFLIFCSDGVQYPRTEINRLNLGLSADYTIHRFVATGIAVSHQQFGKTTGYGGSLQYLTLEGSLLSFEPLLIVGGPSLYTKNSISVGLGPGLYRTAVSRDRNLSGTSFTSVQFGLVGSIRLRVPIGPLFVQAQLVRRFVGDHDYGPVEGLPRSDASFTHSVVVFGAGFRFGGGR